MAGVKPTIVLIKLIKIKLKTISYDLIGVINKFDKFLDHNSSRKDIVSPNCPLKRVSHKITADKITFKTPSSLKVLLEIRKLVKYPQNNI